MQKAIAVALALSTYDDSLLRDLELSISQTAKPHEAHTRSLLQTVPGIGKILSLVLLDDIHHLARFPRGQAFVSDGRLVKCAKASAGKRVGTAGKNIGHAHRTWAFSEAAPLCLRNTLAGQKLLARLEKTHGTGQALTILAHQLGRAVYDMLKRHTAFDLEIFLRASRRRAGAPAVSRDTYGMSLNPARCRSCLAASWNAQACIGPLSQSPRV